MDLQELDDEAGDERVTPELGEKLTNSSAAMVVRETQGILLRYNWYANLAIALSRQNTIGHSLPAMTDNHVEGKRSYGRLLLGELLWIAPTLSVATFLGVAIYKSTRPEALAAIIVIPITVVVPVLIYRLQAIGQHKTRDLSSAVKLQWHGLSYFLSLSLLAVTVFGPTPTFGSSPPTSSSAPPILDDDPAIYLAKGKTVRIGINGNLPGWSLGSSGNYEGKGFDVRLAEFLEKEYEFRAEYVPLKQHEREHQWDGTAKEPVDLVISTFSITPYRLKEFDMAGPYYLDASTVWKNADKSESSLDGKVYGCAVKGTTGLKKMKKLQEERDKTEPGRFIVDPPEGQEQLLDCVDSFFKPSDRIQYIASDWSILRAYDPNVTVTKADSSEEVVDSVKPQTSDEWKEHGEKYGIALRNNHPNVCKSLSTAIDKFLSNSINGWDEAQADNLYTRSVRASWHKPSSSEKEYCN